MVITVYLHYNGGRLALEVFIQPPWRKGATVPVVAPATARLHRRS